MKRREEEGREENFDCLLVVMIFFFSSAPSTFRGRLGSTFSASIDTVWLLGGGKSEGYGRYRFSRVGAGTLPGDFQGRASVGLAALIWFCGISKAQPVSEVLYAPSGTSSGTWLCS